jgi:dTDP-6-deoxy-L-talose 4-dehydrogenase (NAD+)
LSKVAILGANGFLGIPVVSAFEVKGWEVIAFSRNKKQRLFKQEVFADLFDEASLKSALSQTKPTIVLSTAWDTEHGKFWTNESNTSYKDATLRFAEISFEAGVETFIGLGTMSEYGVSPGFCNADVTPLVVNDIYSRSKIETGLRLKQIGEAFGRQTHWARVFQAFGPNEKSERYVPGLITSLRKGNEFSIRTPNFEMDWIHTADVASAIVFMIENELNHFVDIGTGLGTTVKELSELICEELDLDSTLLDYSGQIPGHEKKAVVDKRSQLLSLGWQPAESLRNRIKSLP